MDLTYNQWRNVFIFCIGVFLGTAFCMKWMEDDLRVNNDKFTIIGLELFYSKQKVAQTMSLLDDRVQTILKYHLFFDFAFMAGVYPGIAALCMMARKRLQAARLKNVLSVFAALQLVAWLADIFENAWLLHWVSQPSIGEEFAWYHIAVVAKWLIALSAAIAGISLIIGKRNAGSSLKLFFTF